MIGEDHERRQHPRYPIVLAITLCVEPAKRRTRATLMDLSRGGLFLKSPTKVQLGHLVEVHFRARPAYACHAAGRVVRIMDTRMLQGFGISFERTNANFEKFLEILDKLKPELRTQFLRQVLEKTVDIALISS